MVIEKYLGEKNAEDLFFSSMLVGLMSTNQAEEVKSALEKNAQVADALKLVGSGMKGVASGVKDFFGFGKDVTETGINTALKLMLAGGVSGVIGANLYDAIKDRVTEDDPETKFNVDMEAMYRGRARELEDSKWMAKVRSMRDELRRGYKKMTPQEYRGKYNALLAALDERRG